MRSARFLSPCYSFVLAVGLLVGPLTGAALAQGKLYALVVCDTHAAGGIADDVEVDRQHMAWVLSKAFDADGRRHRLHLTVLAGKDATPARIYQYYEGLQTTKDDTLLFYYSGHGGMTQDQGHLLAMRYGTVWRSELRGAMIFQKHRLAVM